ncbi:10062_t:CDS:10 [Ambispora leptoticha]|uniref:10062_t:CDS:1 n=1 Tax=Ambispora leptoticha TaxID=144679 RepID=A0A9N9F860_9GLOM|nr:10062_t:CDS:10 [Ambispora leptoticha]
MRVKSSYLIRLRPRQQSRNSDDNTTIDNQNNPFMKAEEIQGHRHSQQVIIQFQWSCLDLEEETRPPCRHNPLPMGLPGFRENSIRNRQQADNLFSNEVEQQSNIASSQKQENLTSSSTSFTSSDIPELKETTPASSENPPPMGLPGFRVGNSVSSSSLAFGDISNASTQQNLSSNNMIKSQDETESGSGWIFTSSNKNIAESAGKNNNFLDEGLTPTRREHNTELFGNQSILTEDFEDEQVDDERDDRIVIENQESEDSETDSEEDLYGPFSDIEDLDEDDFVFDGRLPSPDIIPLIDNPEYLNDPRFIEHSAASATTSTSGFIYNSNYDLYPGGIRPTPPPPNRDLSGGAASLPVPPTTAVLLSQMQREAKPEDFISGSTATTSVSSSGSTSTTSTSSSRILIHYLKNVYGLSVRSGSLVLFAYTAHLQYRAPRLLDRIFDEFFVDTDDEITVDFGGISSNRNNSNNITRPSLMQLRHQDPNWPMYWSVLYSLDKQPNYLPPAMASSGVGNVPMPNPKVQFLEKYASRMNAKFASRNGGGRIVGGLGVNNNKRGRRHQDWHLADIRQKKTYRMLIMQNIRYGDVDLLKFYLERYGPPINSVVRMTAEEQIFLQQNRDLSALLTKYGP